MICTAQRYAWFPDRYARLSSSYCLTLLADLPVSEVVRRLGGRDPVEVPGLAVVHDNAEKIAAGLPREYARITGAAADPYEGFAGRLARDHLAAITGMNGWTLLVETRGFTGVDRSRAARLCRGVTLVAHSAEAGRQRFLWMYDGTVRLAFDSGELEGPDLEAQRANLAAAGFPGPGPGPALAYADYLTGVRFEPDDLMDAFYLCVTVP